MSGRLAGPVLDASIEAYEGVATFYENDLVAMLSSVLPEGRLQSRFEETRASATEAVREFVAHLKALRPYADAGFAIGSAKFAALLKYGEMVELPLEQLLLTGEEDLRRNIERFEVVAKNFGP